MSTRGPRGLAEMLAALVLIIIVVLGVIYLYGPLAKKTSPPRTSVVSVLGGEAWKVDPNGSKLLFKLVLATYGSEPVVLRSVNVSISSASWSANISKRILAPGTVTTISFTTQVPGGMNVPDYSVAKVVLFYVPIRYNGSSTAPWSTVAQVEIEPYNYGGS